MTDVSDPNYGRLTDEAFERSRLRNGIPQAMPMAPHNFEVSIDGLRHFAFGYGDDNPLYCDEEYAAGTRWGGLINPPTFLYTMGEDASPRPVPPEIKAILRGDPFAGLGSYQAVMEFEWWRPLQLRDRLKKVRAQVGVADKRSEFGGRSAHVTNDFIFANQRGELHAIQRGTWINAERGASKERQKEQESPEPYTPEQLAEIDAAYERETRRGAEPRWFEDVQVGDIVDPKVKGPLRTTDIVVWHMGWGMQLTPPGGFRLSYLVRKKAPGLFPPNALNVPDTVQRLHWEPERARELGLATSYDYGGLRETWLSHLVTDWMGDDAWLWKLDCQHRKFNYVGDTQWLTGEVLDKVQTETPTGVRSEVRLAIRCTNQRGAVTSPGTAIVLLPSREHGQVVLPKPPASSIEELLAYEIERLKPE
ncbi:MAG: acyl dehydratase [Actinobacteria bacterium]|nr:acyl dehydratase [Actinomycetota bacterium]MSW76259.1 acyl dehydratase [Actinomycetota bacterium]MSX56506.1 acyl dehydratase [Actinomycetota bacterium]MSX92167.1 acyl dehydratase [Actinomycetota bacterium]MSZ81969.1 acyl dehydratase [Actinomycetota bacterium]